MKHDVNTLPDDMEALKQIVIEQAKDLKYQLLEEKYKTLQRMFFGKRSEKLTPEDEFQCLLFNEPEDGASSEDAISAENDNRDVTAVKEYTRRKAGRKPLPAELPREEVIHDIPAEEKKCSCCGSERKSIGSETTEELDIIPAAIKVIRKIDAH